MSWYNSSWKYRVKITVDHSKIGSDLTDFPVYVDLSTLPSGFHTNVKSDGGDIRVTRSDGTTECPREVVFYDSTNDKGELHFKANSLSSTTDTDFYIYYGNASASDYATDATYGARKVWTNGYVGVYHLQATSGTQKNSATSSDDLSVSNGTPDYSQAGKMGSSMYFARANGEYIRTNSVSSAFSFGTGAFSVSAWYKGTTSASYLGVCGKHPGSGAGFTPEVSGGKLRVAINSSTSLSTASVNTGSWKFLAMTRGSSGNFYGYIDGSQDGSGTDAGSVDNTAEFTVGNWGATSTYTIDGYVDEVRVLNIALSADWLGSEYSNQNSPTTFYTVGTQEAGSTEPVIGEKYPLPPFRRS